MKSMIVVALALVAVAVALPVDDKKTEIVASHFEQAPDGAFSSGFQTSDGTQQEVEGVLKEVLDEEKKPHTVVVVRGSYQYVNPEGGQETISYTADENGYHAEGPSIPQPPARR